MSARGKALFATLLAALVTASAEPPAWISGLIEPGPPPKPVVRGMRHPPYKPPQPAPSAPPVEETKRTDWAAKRDLLPRDAAGGTDWALALRDGLIEPKSAVDGPAEEQPVLDLDVELVPAGMPDFKVKYPHKTHTQMLACTNCHTDIFQMQAGADAITMEKIMAGEFCGRCHGKVAFEVMTGCPRCHVSMPQ